MAKINKRTLLIIFAVILTVILLIFALIIMVRAATTPSLGAAATYGVLANTYTNTSSTTINGDVGFTTPPATPPGGTHTNYGSGAPYTTAGTDQGSALSDLAAQPCTFNWGSAVDLSTDATHGTAGIFTPGVYCSTGAMSVTAGLTLSGSGTYIFRAVGALNTTAGAVVTLADGASACDVFWTPSAATTLGANTTFVGNAIDDAGITVGANTTWSGRALAFGGTVTTDTSTISVPSCASPATINVVKTVINDNGRTKNVADFPLFVSGTPVTSGATTVFAPGTYAITETADANYTQTFSGDCDASGNITIVAGDASSCVVTNDDIGEPVVVPPVPPLITVVKVPDPLTIPVGPGSATYTYTLQNIGTVPATNITMADDTCSPLVLTAGDTNANAQLEVSETWTYTCSDTLAATHTNTVVATGWANGVSATDTATATVVVGSSTVPPLIHVTKVPAPLTLLAGGGSVTYTMQVTNPGTAALTNVQVNDDKCSPMTYISGDADSDSALDSAETWVYTCQANLTKTTTNIVTATGEANGLTARDTAIATVIVAGAAPGLPNTGIESTIRQFFTPLFQGG